MADVIIDPQNKNPDELVTQGIRAYFIRNYPAAVQALSLASQMLTAEHGDKHDSLADVYFYYGKALLELSREEAEPLGDAVAKTIEDDSDSEEAEVPEEEAEGDTPEEAKTVNGEVKNGEPSSSSAEQKSEDVSSDESGEEEPSDLQLAWEVLELAKIIYEKRGEDGKKNLAEALIALGEISLESENFEYGIDDIKNGLEIMASLPDKNERALAQTHYKLGIAFSTNSQIEEAIGHFNSSLELLKTRIKTLEEEDKEKHEGEIAQMKELIPEIEEKISDMRNFKEEVVLWQKVYICFAFHALF